MYNGTCSAEMGNNVRTTHKSILTPGLAEGGSEATGRDLSDLLEAILREYFGVASGRGLHARNANALLGLGLELAVLLEELVRAQKALLQASAALGATCIGEWGMKRCDERMVSN